MKTKLITAMLVLGFGQISLASQFSCFNNGFRQAKYEVTHQNILIQDSPYNTSLNSAVLNGLPPTKNLFIQHITLEAPKSDLLCQNSINTYDVNCAGDVKNAILHVAAHITYADNTREWTILNFQTEFKNFKLTTDILDPNLFKVSVETEALINGTLVTLKLSTPFHNSSAEDDAFSACSEIKN